MRIWVCLLVLTVACGTRIERVEHPTIRWDTYGVPHIIAPNLADAFYAQGWSQARAHGDLILRLYGQARGRAAEYWGKDYLQSDRWMHLMDVPGRSADWYLRLSAEERAWMDAFAAGVNDYAKRNPGRIDDEVEAVLPIHATDLLAHQQRVVNFTFVVNQGVVRGARQVAAGSNAWAIAPTRSASGNAMLVANPHLPWRDFFLFFESHMVVGDIDIYGTTLVGHPGITLGFTPHLGWTHTVNTHDGYDLYKLTLEGNGYRYGDEVRELDIREQSILVRGEDGEMDEEVMGIRSSIHGPIIAQEGDTALALRVVGLGENHILRQYVDMWQARDLESFEAALSQLQMPMFTTMYADANGQIMHLFGGLVPRLGDRKWTSWKGEPLDGSDPATLWTETHPYEDLPRVVDPETGWLQNANDPPWTTTFPRAIDADDYPAYMAPRFMHYRAQSSVRLLEEDSSITFDELVAYKHDTHSVAADRFLDDLAAAVTEHGDERARAAMVVLEAWDRATLAESRGAVLFQAFFEAALEIGDSFWAEPWREDAPRTTPDGFSDPEAAAALLSRVAAEVEERHGSLDVAWGEVRRFRVADADLPANGGPGAMGIFRVFVFAGDDGGVKQVSHGDSFVAVVEFGNPVRAKVLTSYGNASQEGSSHRTDQLPLLAEQKLRDAWLTEEDILANLEEEEVLSWR